MARSTRDRAGRKRRAPAGSGGAGDDVAPVDPEVVSSRSVIPAPCFPFAIDRSDQRGSGGWGILEEEGGGFSLTTRRLTESRRRGAGAGYRPWTGETIGHRGDFRRVGGGVSGNCGGRRIPPAATRLAGLSDQRLRLRAGPRHAPLEAASPGGRRPCK